MEEVEEGEITDDDSSKQSPPTLSSKKSSKKKCHRDKCKSLNNSKSDSHCSQKEGSHKLHVCKVHSSKTNTKLKTKGAKTTHDSCSDIESNKSKNNKKAQPTKDANYPVYSMSYNYRPSRFNDLPTRYQNYVEIDDDPTYDDLLQQYKRIQTELSSLHKSHYTPNSKSKRDSPLRSIKLRNKKSDVQKRHSSRSISNDSKKRRKVERKKSLTPKKGSSTFQNIQSTKNTPKDGKNEKPNLSYSKKLTPSDEGKLVEISENSKTAPETISANKENLRSLNMFVDVTSAHSVSKGFDNYELLDMEVSSDEETRMISVPSPNSIQNLANRKSEEDDIETLRAELIQSWNKKKILAKCPAPNNIQVQLVDLTTETEVGIKTAKYTEDSMTISDFKEPVSPNPPSINVKKSFKELKEDDIEALRAEAILSLSRSKTEVRNTMDEMLDDIVAADCNIVIPKDNVNTTSKLPCLSVSHIIKPIVSSNSVMPKKDVSKETDLINNGFKKANCTKKNFKSKFKLLKTKDDIIKNPPTVFMKQAPVIIKLDEDSSTEEEELDESTNNTLMFSSLEKLIESVKIKSNAKQIVQPAEDVASCLPETQKDEYNKLKEKISRIVIVQGAENNTKVLENRKPNKTLHHMKSIVPLSIQPFNVIASCLSESQQEEYNKLKEKISKRTLGPAKANEDTKDEAQNEISANFNVPLSVQPADVSILIEINKTKEISTQKELQNNIEARVNIAAQVQKLREKIDLAVSTDGKYTQLLQMLKIQANKNKLSFINANVTVAKLREKLSAAEKVQKKRSQEMFQVTRQIEKVLNLQSKNLTLVKNLESECKKLEPKSALNS